jgi:hypothetical protein
MASDYKRRIKYQRISLPAIAAASGTSEIETATDKQYRYVTGIAFEAVVKAGGDANKAIQNSMFTRFDIDQQEIFPKEGFEVKFVTTGLEVSPNDRFYNCKENAESSNVSIAYTDGGAATGAELPYTPVVILRLENLEEVKK